MNRNRGQVSALGALLLGIATALVAQDAAASVDLEGPVRYRIDGAQVTFQVGRIVNYNETTTGTLHLTLWLTVGADPNTSGHQAARISLAALDGVGRLDPGSRYQNVRLTTDYKEPPSGTYHVHVYVSEQPDLSTTLDVRTFKDTITVRNAVALEGTVAFRVAGETVALEVERIANHTASTTATLHLTLWMTEEADPHTAGHVAARVSLSRWDGVGRLDPGDQYTDVELVADFAAPPPGTYHVHLYLSAQPDLAASLSLITFTDTVTFAGDDHADDLANATTVSVPSRTPGRLEQAGDVDVFRVELSVAGKLRARTVGSTDTYGTLKNADGATVVGDDDSGSGSNFSIAADVQPGSWYVEVHGFDYRETGSYTLVLALDSAPDEPIAGSELGSRHLGDFNGDGRDDVLLRHTDGRWYYYPMRGRRVLAGQEGTANLTTDTAYRTAGIGDFNGDGRDDVLLRHAAGHWYYYAMDGRRHVPGQNGAANLTGNLDFEIAGVGDFNGDGRDDVLLRHADGSWHYYPMNGRQVVAGEQGTANLTTDLADRLVGIGDFNGDGRDDVLLRHADGRWHYYPMNGRSVAPGGGSVAMTQDLAYRVAGVGDFDGDGRADVLLRHLDGRWLYYPMDGRSVLTDRGQVSLTEELDYGVAGIGDLNGDGRDDVLLRHADGRWYYYPMNGRGFVPGRGSADLTQDLDWTMPSRGFPPSATQHVLSGTLSVAAGQVLDGDTNDPSDPVEDNSRSNPQPIPLPVAVAGHASAVDDAIDAYRVYLPATTRFSLAIADANASDLDLYLADASGNVVGLSAGIDNLEVIQTNRTGEHLVFVQAFSGSGNYSLVAAIVETASGAAGPSLPRVWSRDGEFVANELVALPHRDEKATAALPIKALAAAAEFGFEERFATPTGSVVLRADPGSAVGVAPPALRFASDDVQRRATTLLVRKRLLASGAFAHVQPNYVYRASAVPDDVFYSLQWHYAQINLPQAWDVTTGDDQIVTAVIDTGVVADHPDIQARLLRDGRGRVAGFDFISDPVSAADGDGIDGDPYDVGDREIIGQSSSFHGTHVAGTVGATTNNGSGVAGVTWRGKIMPIRVLGVGGGTSLDIAEGIRYAAGLSNASGRLPPRPANVINLSLGPDNEQCMPLPAVVDRTMRAALTAAVDAGATVVASAGNDDCHVPAPMSTVEGVISVGAVDHFGRAPYSNFGPTVDVVAPGGNALVDADGDGHGDGVWSVHADDSVTPLQHTFRQMQGTSMAAPHVAGVIGLMLAANPDLTPADINQLLAGTHPDPAAGPITEDWGRPGRDDEFGNGLINAHQAVRVAQAIRGGTTSPVDGPVLAVAPTRLYFGATANVLRARLSNAGTGTLTISRVTADQSWLSASFDDWPTLVVRVDRTGLDERTHVGHVGVESNGGNLTIPVTMQVQREVVAADVGTVYVLALDTGTHENRSQATTNVRLGYAFEFPPLASGQYFVAAGTDRDNDGYICDAGEACGMWPLLDSPATLDLDADRSIDFGVSIDLFARVTSQSAASTRTGKRGFRIGPVTAD